MIIIILTTMITTSYGAELVFCTPTPTGRKETADRIAAETGGVIVHPYDNEDVIAGQVVGLCYRCQHFHIWRYHCSMFTLMTMRMSLLDW